jgi:hypothetical protein
MQYASMVAATRLYLGLPTPGGLLDEIPEGFQEIE